MDVATLEAGSDLAAAAEAAAPHDVLVLAPGARLPDGGLERLAAHAQDTVATVAALALEGAAPALLDGGLVPRTVQPRLVCTLVRRSALQLAGPLDDGFLERCTTLGLLHVVADDVLAGGVPETPVGELDAFEHRELPGRPPTRIERALTNARRVVDGLEVTIDGRVLRGLTSGTEVALLALIDALERLDDVRVRVLLEDDSPPGLLGEVETVREDDRRGALVHRPFQVSSVRDLRILPRLGERLVVTHLDLILYHDAAYHADRAQWASYRRLTAAALAAADFVVTISDRAREDLLAEDLIEPSRVRTVYLGVDHLDAHGPGERPPGVGDRPFIAALGSDLAHKNRPFAAALVRELNALGWDGELVLAGPHVEHGGSPPLPGVKDLGPVSEAQLRWLYREAAAIAYPSTTEGFGLIPFEAAAFGTPALVAPVSALAELVPAEHALLVPWDARATAERVLPVLREPQPLVAGIKAAGERFTWEATARALLDVYDEALRRPARESATVGFQALEAEETRIYWEDRYWTLRNDIGPTGLSLVGSEGALPDEAQRTLSALAQHRLTRRPFLAALRAAGKVKRP